jgi:hypothetical protein
MSVRLRSVVRGGMRAVTYRNGVRNSTIYLGTEADVYEPATLPSGDSLPDTGAEPEARGQWGPFAGWYQIPKVGLAAIYGAVEVGPVAVPA